MRSRTPHRLRRALAGLALAAACAGAFAITPTVPAQAAAVPLCIGYNGLQTANTVAVVMAGNFVSGSHPAYHVATGTSVNWAADPYHDQSWRVWFHSLKWVGALIYDYQRHGNRTSLDRATALVADYVSKNPLGHTSDPTTELLSMGHRAQLYACLAEANGDPAWLKAAGSATATYLESHWAGVWNQGLDQDLGILTIGCVMGFPTLADFASNRLGYAAAQVFDSQGATNEQAPGYAIYSYDRWLIALDRIAACGKTPPSGLDVRLAKVPTFVAHATGPDGYLTQIGDTEAVPPLDHPGTGFTYVATRGASGTAPPTDVAVYSAGYVFGRSSWSPFADASYYTLRFGPPKALHGHFDRTQVTFYSQHRQVLLDSGHIGYTDVVDRTWLWSPEAHNVLTVTGLRADSTRPTTLVSQFQSPGWDAYRLSDAPYDTVTRVRNVLIARGPDFIASYDMGGTNAPRQFLVNWHLPIGMGVVIAGRSRATATNGAAQTTIIRVAMPNAPLGPGALLTKSGIWSPRLNTKYANPIVYMPTIGRSTGTFSVIVPAATGTPVSAGAATAANGHVQVTVTVGAVVHVIEIGRDGSLTMVS